MKGIVRLISYPKSGNAWFPTCQTNYLRNAEEPARVNRLDGDPIASPRLLSDDAGGYDSSGLTPDEADTLRPEVYLQPAQEAGETLYCKTHDDCTLVADGCALIPAAELYFLRNPLDVAVSMMHHDGHGDGVRTTVLMANVGQGFRDGAVNEPNQLRQKLLTGREHVRRWGRAPDLRVVPLRYEDIHERPGENGAPRL